MNARTAEKLCVRIVLILKNISVSNVKKRINLFERVTNNPREMEKEKRDEIIAEFGVEEGEKIIGESIGIEEHCLREHITQHSISADGYCNMGCC